MTETDERRETAADGEITEQEIPAADIPEEGFVPFNQEVSAGKQKRKFKLLILLLCLAAVFGIVIGCSSYFDFYKRIMRQLRFDYRNGEEIDESSMQESGSTAERVAEAIGGHTLSLHANVYYFSMQGYLSLQAAQYQYTHGTDGAAIQAKIGESGRISSKKKQFRAENSGQTIELIDGTERITDNNETALLYDFLFSVKSHDSIKLSGQGAYYTRVNENSYYCEIWLMEDMSGSESTYYTLYRYYAKNQLAAVRMLSSSTEQMTVYDITDYTAE